MDSRQYNKEAHARSSQLNTMITESTLQTAVAVAEHYYFRAESANKLYDMLGPRYSGFPGIWYEVAQFALAMDQALAEQWIDESRSFADDVEELTDWWMDMSLDKGQFVAFEKVLKAHKENSSLTKENHEIHNRDKTLEPPVCRPQSRGGRGGTSDDQANGLPEPQCGQQGQAEV